MKRSEEEEDEGGKRKRMKKKAICSSSTRCDPVSSGKNRGFLIKYSIVKVFKLLPWLDHK
jgi:hypothetical protein